MANQTSTFTGYTAGPGYATGLIAAAPPTALLGEDRLRLIIQQELLRLWAPELLERAIERALQRHEERKRADYQARKSLQNEDEET